MVAVVPALSVRRHWPWLLGYVLLGHAGIQLAAFPGTFFSLVWLPSGLALAWACRDGTRALPWVVLGSALVNVPYAVLALDRVGLGAVLAVSLFAPLIDGLQAWLGWRLWGHVLGQRWETGTLWRLLFAILVAVSVTVAMFVALYASAGMLGAGAAADAWLETYVMMLLADAQGMFLVVPVVAAFMTGLAPQRWPLLLLAVGVTAIPLALGRLEPVLVSLLFPLMAGIVIRERFAGAAVLVAAAGIDVALLTAFGWSPLPLAGGLVAFSQWTLLIMAMGTPLLLLGVVLEHNHAHNHELEQRVEDRTDALKKALADAEWLATTDALTGVMNRRHTEATIDRELARAGRYAHTLSVISFDIDHFKRVNDQLGHEVGDRVLQDVCTCVQSVLRGADALGRWGGEEFMIVLPHTALTDAQVVAEKIRATIASQDFRIGWPVTLSLGVAGLRAGENRDQWLVRADQALYDAKHRGRNGVVCAY